MERATIAFVAFIVSACGDAAIVDPVPPPKGEGGIAFEAGPPQDAAASGHAVVVLASGQTAGAIAVDATQVFWSNTENVMRCAIADCAGTMIRLVGQDGLAHPGALALDASNVYWIEDQGTVVACAKTGCAVPTVLATQTGGGSGLAIDDTTLYWIGSSGVLACETAGCAKTPRLVVVTPQIIAFGIAVDDTNVYWTDSTGKVSSCLKGGCPSATTIALDQPSPRDLAIDAAHVYWANEGDGTVMRCGKSSCPSPEVLVKASASGGIAIDDTTVYFETNWGAPQSIQTCPLDGCVTPTLLAVTSANTTNLALDATHVYWGDGSGANRDVLMTSK